MRRQVPPLCALLFLLFSGPALAKGPGARPRTVAVLYFDYDGEGPLKFLRKGLTQMLVTDLTGVPNVQVVERVRLEEALAELELSRTNKIDKTTAAKIGKLLGAHYLVMGGYFDLGGALRVDARVVEVETGRIVGSFGGHKKQDDFLALESELAARLRAFLEKELGAEADAGRTEAPTRKKRPRKMSAKAAARYGRALDAMDRGDAGAARRDLEAVVKRYPDFKEAAVDLASLAK